MNIPHRRFIQSLFCQCLLATGLFLGCGIFSLAAALPTEKESKDAATKTQQALTSDFEATLRAFRGIAAVDWLTAMNLMASDEVKTTWKKENGNLFDSAVHSEAFFAHSILLFSGDSEEQFTGGIYNLWTDQWILVDFTWLAEEREYQISAISWVLCHHKGVALSGIREASILETRLKKRLAHAIVTGHAAAKRGAAAVGGNRTATAREAGKRIRAYADYMRGALAPTGDKVLRPLRAAVLSQMEEAGTPAIPVYFTGNGDRAVVVFSDPQMPFELFFGTYELDGKKMVLTQSAEKDLQPKGGQP